MAIRNSAMSTRRFLKTFHRIVPWGGEEHPAPRPASYVLVAFQDDDHGTTLYFNVQNITTEPGSHFHNDDDIIITVDATTPVVAGTMVREQREQRETDSGTRSTRSNSTQLPEQGPSAWQRGELDPHTHPDPLVHRRDDYHFSQHWLAIGDAVEVWSTVPGGMRAYTGKLAADLELNAIVEPDREYQEQLGNARMVDKTLVFAKGSVKNPAEITPEDQGHGWEYCEVCRLWFAPGTYDTHLAHKPPHS